MMANRIFQISTLLFFIVLVCLIVRLPSEPQNQVCALSQSAALLKQLNNKTAHILQELVKTKYFRLLRINLNSECPLPYMNKLCQSKSCSVCRCDQKDIPQNWIKTDKVQSTDKDKDVWSKEREETPGKWVWHVEDEENDKGEYFDVNTNVQSYSGYNGSYIWSLIYEQNCFKGANHFEQMCLEQQVLYKIISGLHTSISSHLSRLYKNVTKIAKWADKQDSKFFFNHVEYNQRVLSYPERVKNLLFLYEFLIRSVKSMVPRLENYMISSQNISEDLQATKLLSDLLQQFKKVQLKPLNQTDAAFFQSNNYHVKQYQRYIHNISNILNCVQCEKCRLFGKMQTYGLGTAMKVLLGYNEKYKRNELVAMFNTFNKISISVNTYFNYKSFINQGVGGENYKNVEYKDLDSIGTQDCQGGLNLIKVWVACGFVFLLFIWTISNFNTQGKVKKQFKHAFPPAGHKNE